MMRNVEQFLAYLLPPPTLRIYLHPVLLFPVFLMDLR